MVAGPNNLKGTPALRTSKRLLVNVFDFGEYRNFLNSYFKSKKRLNPAFSTRVWCNRLNVKSTASLNMILRGHRHPGEGLIEKFLEYFPFSKKEAAYFEKLIRVSKCKGDAQRQLDLLAELKKLHPLKKSYQIDFSTFNSVSNWYYLAIRELVNLPGFTEDSTWISKRLKGLITPKMASVALKELEQLKLLKRDRGGSLKQTNVEISSANEIPSEAIKMFHEQSLLLARDSVRSVPVETRHISSATFNLELASLVEFKKELFEMQQYLYQKYQSSNADETYQLNVQLIPLTNSETLSNGDKE